MGRAKPLVVGERHFRTRKEALEFFQAMLRSYSPGDRVRDVDAALLDELLKRHPQHAVKRGDGLDHFRVKGADFGSQCFFIYRVDGSFDDFSYTYCINGY